MGTVAEKTKMQLLTNSSLTTFKTCPRKYYLQYRLGYVPATEPEYFYIGTLFHSGLEAMCKVNENQLEAALDCVRSLHAKSVKPDPYLIQKVVAMLEGYWNMYKDDGYGVMEVEKEFRAPLLNPETTQASRIYELGGKIDKIVQAPDGRKLNHESKTTSEEISPEAEYWRKLSIDSQVSQYYIGAHAIGQEVEGCLYDVTRKPELRPLMATPVEDRKYKKTGELYASQRENDETPEQYLERLRADIQSRPWYYYARKEVPRSKEDLSEYLFDVWQTAQTIRSYEIKDKWPRYTHSCVSAFGSKCAYFEFCTGQASLEDPTKFKKLENVHRELTIK